MVVPVAGLTLLGTLAALVHLQLVTFALGSGTFPLAFVVPGVVGSKMLLRHHPTVQTVLICLGALACNLALDAVGSSLQVAILGLG